MFTVFCYGRRQTEEVKRKTCHVANYEAEMHFLRPKPVIFSFEYRSAPTLQTSFCFASFEATGAFLSEIQFQCFENLTFLMTGQQAPLKNR
jgi:hypothetical protein